MSTPAVLVVDDDAPTRRLVRRILEADGLRVHEAKRASDALVVASATSPDLVLLDLILPDANGLEFVFDLRKHLASHVPVLAFSGLLADGAESRLSAAAFDDIVAKPVEPARLRAILRTYLPDGRVPAAAFGAGRRLLVVDDDVPQRKMVAFKLSRLGFDILHAADGAEAVQIAQHRRPDAVISDVLMPSVDGFELCKQLRRDETFARVPIVLLTNSYLEEGDRAHAMRAGADAYLIRTPELRELTDVLRECLAHDVLRAAPVAGADEAPAERAARALRQLDRQVAQNAALTRRTTMLSAQLAVLGGFATALSERRSLAQAMDSALVSCFDAGSISWGVLIARDAKTWQHRCVGLFDPQREHVEAAWERIVDRTCAAPDLRTPIEVPISELVQHASAGGTVLLAPMLHTGALSGVLVLRSTASFDEHRVAFGAAIAAQVGVALALERAFRDAEAAAREVAHQVAERSRELAVVLTSESSRISVPDLASADRFGTRYRVIRALGEGGMGAVFEVERITDARRLALKVMTGDVSREHAARFAREAEIGARVHAPHVVEIVDIGVARGGAPFLVMELITGGSLEVHRARFGDAAWALPILADVADGLVSLHSAGVVHRDLKPGNVLLDDAGVAKVSDFGIARLGGVLAGAVDAEGPTQTPQRWTHPITHTGAVLGTPFYMAPEAAQGGRAVGAPADVFAFGVLSYELLTAQPVFTTPPVLLALASQPIPAPPTLGQLPADVRGALRACLAEDPAGRPQSAELMRMLRRFARLV